SRPPRSTFFPYTTLFRSGAETPWDLAHSQVASQLGIDQSAILFAEPDLAQSFPDTNEKNPGGEPLALDAACNSLPQNDFGGKKRSEEHTSELQSLAYLVC